MHEALRRRAREMIAAGRLPRIAATRSWAGFGTGAPCALCGERIDASEPEIEMDYVEGTRRTTLVYHRECSAAWDEERRARLSDSA